MPDLGSVFFVKWDFSTAITAITMKLLYHAIMQLLVQHDVNLMNIEFLLHD